MDQHTTEVAAGGRFEFGKNWRLFIDHLDEERIAEAEASLRAMLEVAELEGKTFLDCGSGSGLFSLAARRLGATVRSFDYDPISVASTTELRRRYFPADGAWVIERGSVLDSEYLQSLGTYDIVYSWGVLHHTGAMWQALSNVSNLVTPGGKMFIALYNDEGRRSRQWRAVKRLYNRSSSLVRLLLLLAVAAYFETRTALANVLSGRSPLNPARLSGRTHQRGMSYWHDLVDWVGGYPFEVARPDQVFKFFRDRGFTLIQLRTLTSGHGNNEFVFQRNEERD